MAKEPGAKEALFCEYLKILHSPREAAARAGYPFPERSAAVNCFYFEGKSVTQTAKEQGVNKSTVSRNLKRAQQKLALSMRYGLSPLYLDRD